MAFYGLEVASEISGTVPSQPKEKENKLCFFLRNTLIISSFTTLFVEQPRLKTIKNCINLDVYDPEYQIFVVLLIPVTKGGRGGGRGRREGGAGEGGAGEGGGGAGAEGGGELRGA